MTSNGAHNGTPKPAESRFSSSDAVPLFLDGRQITTNTTFDVTSPVDNKVCWSAYAASEEDAVAAIAAAEKAFKSWRHSKPAQRRDIFLRAYELFRQRKEDGRFFSTKETGAPDSMFEFEYNGGQELCLQLAGLVGTLQGTVPNIAEEGASAMMLREPYGVVLAIAPWNAPHVLGLRACLAPLAAGNTVILKGPEFSPATYYNIVDVLHQAGLPPGCLNTIYHRPEDAAQVTNAIISHPSVKKVNFTGSTNVGAILASLCGKHLKPCVMELGGKAPSIVCEDANLDQAAQQCALGAFLHAGQICMSTERIIVHSSVADDFKERLKKSMDAIFGSGPTPVLINGPPVSKNKKLLDDALSKGARTIYGDAQARDESRTRMKPVIIENVSKGMDIYHTESFGPTVAVYVVQNDDEALELANDTDYGLSSAVFTEDLRRGLKFAKNIETGAVHINGMSVHDEAWLPHGGAKKSGFGRFNGREGLEEWVRTKVVTWKD